MILFYACIELFQKSSKKVKIIGQDITYLFIAVLCLFVFSCSAHANNDEEAAYKQVNFDDMLEHYRPARSGTVDITLFRKIKFEAVVVELPLPRKHKYLANLLHQFGGENPPKVTMGLVLMSSGGKEWSVYIIDELVPQVNRLVRPGDKVKFYSYHAYTSDYGPGLVVSAFERHPRPSWWDKTKQWLHDYRDSHALHNTLNSLLVGQL